MDGEIGGTTLSFETLGNIGDFIGGLGVLITLIYLAVQIRQNTRSVRGAAAQQALSAAAEFLERVASDPALTDIFTRGTAEPEKLAPADQARFGLLFMVFMALFRRFEAVFRQHQRGTVEEEDWAGLRVTMLMTCRRSFARQWWPGAARLFSPAFREFIQSLQNESVA